jgi:hypothetical protein
LLFLKIDFRFVEDIFCCGDDHDYLLHTKTLALDFDLDYSNQLKGIEDKRFRNNGFIAPIGFIGTGILAAPFLFVGNLFDNIILNLTSNQSELLNYKILFYSLSPVFYYFLTFKLLTLSFDQIGINYKARDVFILFSGSGLFYYAFERFSMTHVYEAFSGTLIFYFTARYYFDQKKNNNIAFLIPVTILLGVLIRWVNYYFLFIPGIFYFLFHEKIPVKKLLRKNYYFVTSYILSIVIFLLHTKYIYGRFTFDPRFVYTSGSLNIDLTTSLTSTNTNLFFNYIDNLRIIFFSQEFGILYFSPIIIISFAYLIFKSLPISNIFSKGKWLIIASYFQVFSIYFVWQSSGSSYGLRYLYSLIPLSLFVYFSFRAGPVNSYMHKTALFLSLFSILSVLFFETSLSTQLSLDPSINSWGRLSRYTERYYLKGVLESFFTIDAYLKIFTTSFLGAIFFKSFLLFSSISQLNMLLTKLGLPVENTDFQEYLIKVNTIGIDKFLMTIFFASFLITFLNKKVKY